MKTESLISALATLSLGAVGGWLADRGGLPLAWMLGAMSATFLATMLRLPVRVSERLRAPVLVVLGLFIGDSVSPETLAHVSEWPISLGATLALLPFQFWLGLRWFRRWAGVDGTTAVLAAGPGALSAMVAATEELGGDTPRVVLAHVLRIAVVVTVVPFLIFGVFHLADRPAAPPITHASLTHSALLLGTAAGLWALLHWLRLPLATLLSGVLASLLLHGSGVVVGSLPDWVLTSALVVTGSALGCRFLNIDWAAMRRMALTAVGYTLVLLMVGAAAALGVAHLTGLPVLPLVLAYAPGGVSEMCLIAIALQADPGFVALHHIARLVAMILFMPLIMKMAAASR